MSVERDSIRGSLDDRWPAGAARATLAAAGLLCVAGVTLAGRPAGACTAAGPQVVGVVRYWIAVTVGAGVVGLLAVQAAGAVPGRFLRSRLRALRRHRREFATAGATLVALGPLAVLGGKLAGLPLARCVTLVPF